MLSLLILLFVQVKDVCAVDSCDTPGWEIQLANQPIVVVDGDGIWLFGNDL
jgi:hypothetical protein